MAFADFLDGDLELATSNEPLAQLGVWLQSYQPLTIMVNIEGLRMLPGSSPSNQFIGWTFADPDGKPVAVGAVLAEQHDEWTEMRRYIGLDVLARSRAGTAAEASSADEVPLTAITA